MSTLTNIPILTDARQATRIGYAEGSSLRKSGGLPDLVNNMRDVYYETPHRAERRKSRHYAAWRQGFDAGYLGQPIPALSQNEGEKNARTLND
jgi:hypothetical protein